MTGEVKIIVSSDTSQLKANKTWDDAIHSLSRLQSAYPHFE